MAKLPHFESFAPSMESHQQVDRGPTLEWLEGYERGLDAGQAIAASNHAAVSVEIAQTLADMAFGYTEARQHLLRSLGSLFNVLMSRVLPGLSEVAQAAHLIELLKIAASQDSAHPVELAVHPARVPGLTSLLPYAVGLPIVLISEPTIGLDQAVLRTGHVETVLDVGALIEGATSALAAICSISEERENYG